MTKVRSVPQIEYFLERLLQNVATCITINVPNSRCSRETTDRQESYVIDGGIGNELPLKNLEMCLEQQRCLKPSGDVCTSNLRLDLDAIIVTHPDKDHVGGVTTLLEKHSYNGELVITKAFDKKNKEKLATKKEYFLSKFLTTVERVFEGQDAIILPNKCERYGSLQCHFPLLGGIVYVGQHNKRTQPTSNTNKLEEGAPLHKIDDGQDAKPEEGRAAAMIDKVDTRHDVPSEEERVISSKATEGNRVKNVTKASPTPGGDDKGTTAQKVKRSYPNDSSIITTINEVDDGFDVMLTGDSAATFIQSVLDGKSKGATAATPTIPHIKVFQVPHHGSKWNSCFKRSTESIVDFYTSFKADVYVISGGGHAKFDHPDREVLSGIVSACFINQHKSMIVVTNSFGLKKTKVIPKEDIHNVVTDWQHFVTICHLDDLFSPTSIPAVMITSDNLQPQSILRWSPGGYIDKIREHSGSLKMLKVKIFRKDTNACITSCSEQLQIETTTPAKETELLLVPVPEQPWTDKAKRTINETYILKDSISDDFRSLYFLELNEETRALANRSYWIYTYTDDYFDCKEYQWQSSKRRSKQPFTLDPQPGPYQSDQLYVLH